MQIPFKKHNCFNQEKSLSNIKSEIIVKKEIAGEIGPFNNMPNDNNIQK